MTFKRQKIHFFRLIDLVKLCFIVFLPLFVCAKPSTENYNDRIAEAKLKLLKMIQKETYQLSGFDEFATIPITYPLDICLMEVNRNLYAVCLGLIEFQDRRKTILKILKKGLPDPNNPLYDYTEIVSFETRGAQNIDCVSMGMEGYISVVNEIKSEHYDDITEGSPIFQFKNDEIIPIQYFARPRQNKMQFLKHHDQLLMWQTFRSGPNEQSYCPVFKWTEGTFMEIDHIPCTNAMQVEPFLIDQQIYVAVANYMDEHQNIETHSTIFHYDIDTHKFNLTQQFKTYGAIDIRHIFIDDQHLLVLANSFRAHEGAAATTSNAVIYRYEHLKFVPIQILPFDAGVTQLLPYSGDNGEFMLLISMEEGATKTYQYDGFKFGETPVTFSGGSFGKGVSMMRTYKINDETQVIVVANFEMYRDATNLFRAKFTMTMDYDFTKAFEMFDNWYAGVKEKLHSNRIVETFNEVEALKPPPGFGIINLEHTTVKTIHSDTISSTSIPIDFDELKRAMQRADEIVSKNMVRRPKRLNDSMLQNDLNSSIINRDFDTKQFSMPRILTVNELTVSKRFLAETVNGHKLSDLVFEASDLNLKNFTVDTLVIANNTENVDAIEMKLNEKRMKRDVSITTPEPNVEPLILNNIVVDGLINGLNFSYLVDNVLKTNVENQSIEGTFTFNTLKARSIQTTDGNISDISLGGIARIDAYETMIQPPIRFTQLVTTDKLNVFDRLQGVQIIKGKWDALFKNSRRTQVITGLKEFESIVLLEPITLEGKINISNPIMSKINPIVTVNEDVVIEDTVSFIGNVSIKNLLQAQNIYGKSIRYNVGQLIADGLRLDEHTIDIPLEFKQPIQIQDIIAPTQINNISVENLIQRNVTFVQNITASKIFTSDLTVEGDCDANEINGINVQFLNNTMLKRAAKNQVVTGTIQFGRIIAGKVNAEQILLGKTSIDRLLTTNTDQVIIGNASVHGSVIMNGFNIDINHLETKNLIFGIDLSNLLSDSYYEVPNNSIVINNEKTFENVTIGQLIIESDIWQIGKTTEEIEKQLNELKDGIKFNGSIAFSSNFHVKNLTVNGFINDMPSEHFGQNWLLYEGKQSFIAPQMFTDVTFNDNLQLYGHINGYDLQMLVDDTVNKSEPVALKHVVFDNVIFEDNLNVRGKFAGISIPDDLILTNSDSLQNFNGALNFASNVEIIGTLSIFETINGHNHAQICELLQPSTYDLQKLTIKGDVIFATEPMIEYLNSESFQHILLTTWFSNDQYVNFTDGIHFDRAIFHKPITTAGTVNDVDLQDLENQYLSLNQSQKVTTPLQFHGHVHFRDSVIAETLSLNGLIILPQSDITLNITDFDQNVLKNVKDTQFIRGHWTVNQLHFLGSLSATSINGLNFANDVMRLDRPDLNIISAPKRFRSLTIDRLMCRDGCTLQGIDMDEWMTKATLTGLNNTIQGTVYIKNPIISYVEVHGLVNNMTFNSQTVLLTNTSQILNGAVRIGNRFTSNQIHSLTFENLFVNFINDKNVSEFFENLVRKDDIGNDAGEIFSDLEFFDRIEFENLTIINQLNGIGVNYQQLSNLDNPKP